MAGNSVVLTFIGEDGPLSRTMKRVENQGKKLGNGLAGVTKIIAGLGATGSAVQGVAALGTSLVQMSGAALLAPSALLSAAAAFGTLKLGASGFAAAVAGDTKAMQNLAPAAQKAAGAAQTAFAGLKDTVANHLFAGATTEIKQFSGVYLPILKTSLGGIADGWNGMAKSASAALRTPEAIGAVKGALKGTTQILAGMRDSLGNVIVGFMTLANAGSKNLGGVGKSINDATQRFKVWADEITAGGQFERWVATAKAAFGQLFAVIGNLGHIIYDVITGLAGPTQGLFGSLQAVTGQIRTFLESASGQQALSTLGTMLQATSAALRTVLGAALQQIGPLIVALAPVIIELASAIGGALVVAINIVGPILTGLANTLASMPGSATVLLGVLAGLWAAFQIGNAVLAANRVITIAIAAWPTIVAIATGAWTAAQWLLNAALSANPIGIVVVLIAALVAGIVWAWNNCQTFRDIVMAVWSAVQSAITVAVNAVIAVIGWFGRLPGMIGGWFNGAKDAAVGAFMGLLGWLGGLPGRILGALGALGNLLVSVGRDIVNGLWNGIQAGWSWLTGMVSNLAGSLLDAAKSALGIASPSKLFRDEIGKWIPQGMAVGIDANVGSVIASAKSMTDAAVTAAQPPAVSWNATSGPSQSAPAASGAGPTVSFTGNTDTAFAALFMKMVRSGQIQVSA